MKRGKITVSRRIPSSYTVIIIMYNSNSTQRHIRPYPQLQPDWPGRNQTALLFYIQSKSHIRTFYGPLSCRPAVRPAYVMQPAKCMYVLFNPMTRRSGQIPPIWGNCPCWSPAKTRIQTCIDQLHYWINLLSGLWLRILLSSPLC